VLDVAVAEVKVKKKIKKNLVEFNGRRLNPLQTPSLAYSQL